MSADNKKVVNNENLAAFAEALAAKVPLKSDLPTKLSDLANDRGFTDNIGTITSVTLNGTTTTSGGVDLGYLVAQENGKGLSSNDYTTTEKTKLSGIEAGAEVNVIETVKVNDTALTPDANKAVNIEIPTAVADFSDADDYLKVEDYEDDEEVVAAALNDLNDRVSDLESAPAFTESDPVFSASAASGITAADITNWNSKTSNTGTLTGVTVNGTPATVSNGIASFTIDEVEIINVGSVDIWANNPSMPSGTFDSIAAAYNAGKQVIIRIQDSEYVHDYYLEGVYLETGNEDFTFMNSYMSERFTVYSDDHLYAVWIDIPTESTVSGWGFTKNAGTITGITMNGASKGTSGVVNLGTVVTSETDPVFSASAASGITASDITNWNSKTSNTGTLTGVSFNGVDATVTSGVAAITATIPPEVTESTVSGWGFTKNTGTLTTETDPVFTASAAHDITSSDITAWNGKQDAISDLETIRSNASAGAAKVSNVQADWDASSGLAQILNKPTIPSALSDLTDDSTHRVVTDAEKTAWNGKQNALTFDSTPTQNSNNPVTSGGVYTLITENELVTSAAINDLNDRVSDLEDAPAFTESDPVFSASPAHGITAADIAKWNSKDPVHIDLSDKRYLHMKLEGKALLLITAWFADDQYADTCVQYLISVHGQGELGSYDYCADIYAFKETETYSVFKTNSNNNTIVYNSSDDENWLQLETYSPEYGSLVERNIDIVVLEGTAPSEYEANTIGKDGTYAGAIRWHMLGDGAISGIIYDNSTHTIRYSRTNTTGLTNLVAASKIVSDGGGLTGVKFNNTDATVSNGVASITATIPAAPGTLKTNNSSAQSTSASESLSGTINLHKVAKTGTYSDLIGTPTIPDVSDYFDEVAYDSQTKRINFKHGNTVKKYIDATDFIKDGMVDDVEVTTPSTGTNSGVLCLVVTFNTDAGKEDIEIPISSIFNASNYYTKTETDDGFVAKVSGKGLSTEDYTTAEKTKLSGIETGAQANVKPDWNAASGTAAEILNKPTIPSEVTEATVTGWGFTKNTGTLTTETDPVFSASAAAGITASDITNWNGKTSNTGTITGITMNSTSKGTSGVVDLGTVVTAETDPIFTASAAYGISAADITAWNGKQNALTFDSTPTQNSNNPVTSGGVYSVIAEDELITATALNDLNDRVADLEDISVPTAVSDLTNDLGFTSNTGTLTGVSFNGTAATVSNGVASISAPVDIELIDIGIINSFSNVSLPSGTFNTANQAIKDGKTVIIRTSDGEYYNDWHTFTFAEDDSITLFNENYNDSIILQSNDTLSSSDYGFLKKNQLVTESTVSGWGFTKNTGTYSKPSGGIPASDLASAVQTSLGKADTALQSFTETDPVFSASAAAGITSSDITNWNSKTSNTGTLTGVSFNGVDATITSGVAAITATIPTLESLTTSEIDTIWNSAT